MAKSRKSPAKRGQTKPARKKGPKPSPAAFQMCMWIIVLGLAAQLAMSVIAYPSLPARIPADWVGASYPYHTEPALIVFLVFPGYELALFLVALLTSPKDAQGRRVMESGKAVSLIVLAIVFTALHAGVFHIPHRYASSILKGFGPIPIL